MEQLMQRRDFIYKAIAGFAALSTTAFSNMALAAVTLKKQVVCFKAGSCEFLAADGIWHIAVLADPRIGDAPIRIPLNFEVATDEEFQNIIETQRHFAQKKNAYNVRVMYSPPENYDNLFYRFIAPGIIRDAAARGVYTPVSPSSPTKTLSKYP